MTKRALDYRVSPQAHRVSCNMRRMLVVDQSAIKGVAKRGIQGDALGVTLSSSSKTDLGTIILGANAPAISSE